MNDLDRWDFGWSLEFWKGTKTQVSKILPILSYQETGTNL